MRRRMVMVMVMICSRCGHPTMPNVVKQVYILQGLTKEVVSPRDWPKRSGSLAGFQMESKSMRLPDLETPGVTKCEYQGLNLWPSNNGLTLQPLHQLIFINKYIFILLLFKNSRALDTLDDRQMACTLYAKWRTTCMPNGDHAHSDVQYISRRFA